MLLNCRLLSAGLLLSAALCSCQLTHPPTVSVSNQTGVSLEQASFSAGGTTVELGTIPAGGKVNQRIAIQRDSAATLNYTVNGQRHTENLDVYFTSGMAGSLDVKVEPDRILFNDNLRAGF